jgi:hypothetical protein
LERPAARGGRAAPQSSMSRMLWLTAEVTDGAAPDGPSDEAEDPKSSWSAEFLAWADTELKALGAELGS